MKSNEPHKVDRLISSPLVTDIQAQARAILETLVSTPFDQCFEISRTFEDLPPGPNLYVIRHRTNGLLYLGKTNRLNARFTGRHKAFTWAWLELYPPADIRIALVPLDRWRGGTILSELEAILLRATEPPYRTHLRTQEDTESRFSISLTKQRSILALA